MLNDSTDEILFKDQINISIYRHFIMKKNEVILRRNTLIYLTLCQVIASFIGMLFFLYRRSVIYIIINLFTLCLAICGIYGTITINSIFLIIHCLFTVSVGSAFFIFQIINDLLTDDTSYGDKKRTSDHVLLFVFSLPYLYDVYTGAYNYYWMKSLAEEDVLDKNAQIVSTVELGNNESRIEMNNYPLLIEDNNQNSNLCVICMFSDKNVAFQPCGHVACCSKCAVELVRQGICPICRSIIVNFIKIYI